MQLLSLGPLAVVCLIQCHSTAAQYSNATSDYFQAANQQQGIVLRAWIPDSSALGLSPSSVQSSDNINLQYEDSESFTTSIAPASLSRHAESPGKQARPDSPGSSSVEEKVPIDFDQWINMDMLKEDETPCSSKVSLFSAHDYHHPDYGPLRKSGKEKDVDEREDHSNSLLPFLKLPYSPFSGSDPIPDEDVYLSYNHSTDSDDDGGLAPRLSRSYLYGKHLLHDDYEAEDDHYAGTSTGDNSFRWLLSPTAMHKFLAGEEGSNSENSNTFNDESISARHLLLGGITLPTLLSKDRKKKGKHKTHEEPENSGEMSTRPKSRPLSREELIREVKEIYAGLLMVDAKCLEWDEYPESTPPRRTPLLDTDMNVSPHCSKLGRSDRYVEAILKDRWVEDIRRIFRPLLVPGNMGLASANAQCRFTSFSANESFMQGDIYEEQMQDPELDDGPHLPETLEIAPTFQGPPKYNGEEGFSHSYERQISDTTFKRPFSEKVIDHDHDPWEGSSRQQFPTKPLSFPECQSISSSNPCSSIPSPATISPPPKPKPSKKDHICPTCNSSFKRAFELRKHFKYHSKPIACSALNCTNRFACQKDLKRHQKAAHKSMHCAEQWFCAVEGCRYNVVPFGRRDNLLRHVRNLHTADEVMQG